MNMSATNTQDEKDARGVGTDLVAGDAPLPRVRFGMIGIRMLAIDNSARRTV